MLNNATDRRQQTSPTIARVRRSCGSLHTFVDKDDMNWQFLLVFPQFLRSLPMNGACGSSSSDPYYNKKYCLIKSWLDNSDFSTRYKSISDPPPLPILGRSAKTSQIIGIRSKFSLTSINLKLSITGIFHETI